LRRADELSFEAEDRIRFGIQLVQALRRRGAINEATAIAADIEAGLPSTRLAPGVMARALFALSSLARATGRYEQAREFVARSAEYAAASNDMSCVAAYHLELADVMMRTRQFDTAVAGYQTAGSLFRLARDRARESDAKAHAARAHMFAGRLRMASEALRREIEQGDLSRRSWVANTINYCICLLWLGEWRETSELLEKARAQAEAIGLLSDQSRIIIVQALVALRRSELDEAARLAIRGLEIAKENSLVREELAALECLGEIQYERRKPAKALQYYEECISRGEAIGMSDATTEGKRREAEAQNALGEYEKGLAAAERCIEVAASNEDRYEHAVAHRPLAMAQSMLGDLASAEKAFRQAIEEIRTLGERFELAKTLVEFACHLRDSDATTLALGAAGEHLREARELFTELGVERWIARVDQELSEVIRLTDSEPETVIGSGKSVERGVRSLGSVSIVTRSSEMLEILERLARVAPSDLPVMITGESGTGKELIARALQELSGRPAERFVAVNCAALPRELHESELFGHVKGSFTGATSEKPGLFEQADGGTIFLDEIGDLDPKAQGKLLRVLEDGEFRRVGELKARRVDARLVAATNRDLEQSVTEAAFRGDLYHRLNGLWVRVPALRERPEDIEGLASHFLELFQRQYGKRVNLPTSLLEVYRQFSWPGNVRELRQELHRMVLLTLDGGTMRAGDSQVAQAAGGEQSVRLSQTTGYASAIGEAERKLILDALQQSGGNKARAARILNMSRTTLLGKIRRLGID
jgi:transcriptional regulator with GAF, ATPase, and Fis domain